jgi:hypothetical protein
MVNSADYLDIITRPGRYVLLDRSARHEPDGHAATVKEADGSDGLQMPRAVFDEFCVRGFLRQDGDEDEDRCIVFLATESAYAARTLSK